MRERDGGRVGGEERERQRGKLTEGESRSDKDGGKDTDHQRDGMDCNISDQSCLIFRALI